VFKKKLPGVRFMFMNDQLSDMKRLFSLLSRAPETLKPVHGVFQECIKSAGMEILRDQAHDFFL